MPVLVEILEAGFTAHLAREPVIPIGAQPPIGALGDEMGCPVDELESRHPTGRASDSCHAKVR